MSVGVGEKRVLYDNPSAPIVKFSSTNKDEFFDEEDNMMDETFVQPSLGTFVDDVWKKHGNLSF